MSWNRSILAAGMGLLAGVAGAQPYGWFPGSTAKADDKTGDRVVIVNLANGLRITPDEGWDFTDNSPGADPNVPGFSPDGRYVYLINGGDGNAQQPTGHLYVFDAQAVVSTFSNRGTPPAPLDIELLPSMNEDATEPVGLTVATQGDRVYLTEANNDLLYVWDVDGNGTLSKVVEIPTGGDPSTLWLTNSGDKGYFLTQPTDQAAPSLKVVNTRSNPPSVTATIPLTLPAQGDDASRPFAFAGFTAPAGASVTSVPPSNVALADDSRLVIYCGYTGFYVTSQLGNTVINDPVNVYMLDTANDTLTNGGQPQLVLMPASDQVFFPPLVHSFRQQGVGNFTHLGGSAMIKPDGTVNTLKTPNGLASDRLVLAFGMLADFTNAFFVSSISAADGLAFLVNNTYTPSRMTSELYRYNLPGTAGDSDHTLAKVADIDRPLAIVLGFAGNRVVVGASDTFFLVRVDGVQPNAVLRDSQCVLVNPAGGEPIVTDLQLVAGAYGQQPQGSSPTPTPTATPTLTPSPTPTPVPTNPVVSLLTGESGSSAGLDENSDGIVDCADIIAGS